MKMYRWNPIFPAFFLGVMFLCAASVVQAQTNWKGSCDITFSGTSTLHKWSGTVSAEPFSVAISGADSPSTAKIAAIVKVKAKKMDTDKEKRDENMYESMKVDTHSEVVVTLPKDMTAASTKPVIEGGIPRPTVIPFTLTLLGKDQQKTGTVSKWKYANGVATFTVSFPVSLKASGIEVPAVLGMIRVGDEVVVTAKVTLKS